MFDQDQQRDYAEEQYWHNYCPACDNSHPRDEECSAMDEYYQPCPECGDPSDYCQGHADIYARCPWCQSDDADEYSESLCRLHLAEYEGLSVDELDRRDHEERMDLL